MMENKITITGNNINTIEIPQRITNVVEVLTGPIGPRGEIPTSGSFNFTGSYDISGSLIVSGSIISTDGFTGSLEGTSSWANNSISASFAQTASFLLGSIESASFAQIASFAQTASFLLGSVTSASFAQTASFAQSSLLSQTSSYIQLINVDGFTTYSSSIDNRVLNLENFSSSLDTIFATDAELNAATSSLSASISYLSSSYLVDSASFNNEITNNTNDISSLSSSFISFSSSYNTGSFTGSFTGSLFGTSSWANNSISSSQALNADNSISASHALTASYVNPLHQDVYITGSLNVTSSMKVNGLTYPISDNGEFSFIQTDGLGNLTLQYVNALYEVVYNGETTQITKGTPIYISGSQGANPKAYRADAGDPNKMPVVYIAADDINPSNTGRALALGLITGVNTTGYPGGTEIFVGVGGGWTSTRPTGSAIIQVLGYVTKEGNGGQGVVLNPGPANLPNIPTDHIWAGDINSYPISVPTSSLSVLSSSYALQSLSSSFSTTSSFSQTASFAPDYVLTSTTSSMLSPYVLTSQTSSMSVASASSATSASYAISASHLIGGVTIDTGSLLATASVNLNTITFTKGDGSTFPITVDTGSGGGGSTGPFGVANSSGVYTYYNTFQDAINAASSGQTVEMFADIIETGAVTVNLKNGVNINGNGHTYTLSTTSTGAALSDNNVAAELAINNLTVRRTNAPNEGFTPSSPALLLNASSTLDLTGSRFYNTNGSAIFAPSTSNRIYNAWVQGTVNGLWSYGFIYNSTGISTASSFGNGIYGIRQDTSGTIVNCIGIATSAGGGILTGNSVGAFNCVGTSVSGPGLSGAGSTFNNCVGRSVSGVGISGTSNLHNCTGISVSGRGINGVSVLATNCVGISSSDYAFYEFFARTSEKINCYFESTTNIAVYLDSGLGIFKNSVIRSLWNNASGHAIRLNANTAGSVITNCSLRVANASANCISANQAGTNVKYAGNKFEGSTTAVNANVAQAITNVEDNQGNILI
jgi:hypothetical protein